MPAKKRYVKVRSHFRYRSDGSKYLIKEHYKKAPLKKKPRWVPPKEYRYPRGKPTKKELMREARRRRMNAKRDEWNRKQNYFY